ncbi:MULTISPECIES: aspartate/glutamate racemase family protein [unclassified Sphingomonas]|uniref:aspartate/glutamate racemase family protein n=1 Tax=unclassified Sphingomonas TaxID=196159 RepID=UPI0006FF3BEF|nr:MULTISPECIES: aspartate/glutamate racemase family protein [unclassified Sphingomonas]KQX19105.1 hypothetical protein ASD17_11085 [Sphingomonas sp. Root1294]KQY65306.1 hypothetical protein ASD39_14280 [Sphingomonas sp. Root50]KRB95399.1 hypothetical protein ASE22_05775 [Sphingomonas sp. Root720]
MKKILVIVPIPMGEDGLALRRGQSHVAKVKDDTELVYRAVAVGPRSFQGAQDMTIVDFAVLQAGSTAEKEGFDAVCVDTMSDSGVAALRSVLKIPVVGAGRTAFMTALMLGSKFSIIVMYKPWIPMQQKTLKEYGLMDRLASIRSIDHPPTPYSKNGGVAMGDEEDDVLPKLEKVARLAIEEDGAEVILMGSTTMYRGAAYVAERVSAPVIAAGPLTYRYAEMFLDLGLTQFNDGNTISPMPLQGMLARMVGAAGEHD